jgi:sugar transferase EpsL
VLEVKDASLAPSPVSTDHSLKALVKRGLDVTIASLVGIVALPLVVAASTVILLTSGRPVLFRQERIGLHEQPFTLWKLRTMTAATTTNGELISDAQRVTGVGALLRRTSIDELPQLWNVARGDMSLVGPRPLLAVHRSLYTGDQRRRHEVRPGLTGLAQLAGRQDLPFSRRYELDVEYVDTWTVRGDLALLARTVGKVLRRSGSSPVQELNRVDDIGLREALGDRGR